MRPARLILLLAVVMVLTSHLLAFAIDGDKVDQQVDRITSAPEYYWLRDQESVSDSVQGGGEVGKGTSTSPRTSEPGGGYADCGYSPETGMSPLERIEQGCDADAPGRMGEACDCGPSVGSCGSGNVGFSASVIGYLLGAAAVLFAVWFVVVAIISRKEPSTNGKLADDSLSSPEELRTSEVPRASVDVLMQKARAAADEGDYKKAVGWSYLSGIGILHRAGKVDLKKATTNMGIVEAVRRSHGPTEATKELLFIFEEVFFGAREPTLENWHACRRIVEELL